MSVLVISPGRDPEVWAKELRNQHPGMNVYVYPEDHEKEEVEFAVSWKHPRGIFKNYPNLKVIASMGAGVDHITSDPEIPEHIKITRVIDEDLSSDMSAFVLGLILDHMRNISLHHSSKKWEPKKYQRIRDVKVGILGMGVLGTAVAKSLQLNGFQVSGWANSTREQEEIKIYSGADQMEDLLRETSVLVNLLPLTPQTENILNKDLFQKLPKGAYVINVARGEHLNEHDLLEMIDSGHLSGASLDVFRKEPLPEEHPFWAHSKIQITPHIASITNPGSVVPQIIENYERMTEEEELMNVVERQKGY
ncbi:glyoxylate/hydroxypyruvate reductase A [Antarcticibacterium arcticum]|uniref:Glyoxylate/hydroxypyruvate reductase A n=1 Tax=Antarcticibacterium arcticum TaxID=2585771 RepID=A0A5B8YMR7_9FLAO|nr:glyoxylate/hydroxypyruvate reductase A [Antarcticibacterium arcticum]QED37923.1 glyoxylate/hydroxypyruvate reductase A [Antarcticibacterium arcticum]